MASQILGQRTQSRMTNKYAATFSVRFMECKPRVLLELTNTTQMPVRSVEILTVFLKDKEAPFGGPSRAHIRFDRIQLVQPNEKAVVSHRTWVNGNPTTPSEDQLGRLEVVAGEIKPYVLNISWEDNEGKTQFQRIPVGH